MIWVLLIFNFVILGIFIVGFAKCFHRCPPGKILVIYGKMKTGHGGPKCITKGATFVFPFIQSYQYLDLKVSDVAINLRDAHSKQDDRVEVSGSFTVGISTEPSVLPHAAERLMGLEDHEIESLAKSIIQGQVRLICASRDSDELKGDEAFVREVRKNVERELNKVGLTQINANLDVRVVPKKVNLF